jgi:hypothetical protein
MVPFALSPFAQTKTYSLNMTRPSSIHWIVCSFEHIGQPNVKVCLGCDWRSCWCEAYIVIGYSAYWVKIMTEHLDSHPELLGVASLRQPIVEVRCGRRCMYRMLDSVTAIIVSRHGIEVSDHHCLHHVHTVYYEKTFRTFQSIPVQILKI